jgi:hypothetical protein
MATVTRRTRLDYGAPALLRMGRRPGISAYIWNLALFDGLTFVASGKSNDRGCIMVLKEPHLTRMPIHVELTGEKVNVYPFSDNLPAVQEVPIGTALMIWESPSDGQIWMLVIHEALYFGDRLKESLLCPNQIRAAGNLVQDAPIQFDLKSMHSVTIPENWRYPWKCTVSYHICVQGSRWQMRSDGIRKASCRQWS